MPGPHSVLSVQIGASDQEIKKAYHKKAILLHPDKNGGSVEAKENFIELQKAFEKLTRRDEDEGEAVPFATAWEPSHRPASQRYQSPPPLPRRDTYAPIADPTVRGEPIYEERQPRGACPVRSNRDEELLTKGWRKSFRPRTPPKERDYRPRGRPREVSCSQSFQAQPPRGPSPVYEVRAPRQKSELESLDRKWGSSTTTKYPCTPSAKPLWEEPRNVPSPHVRPSGGHPPVRLPPYEKLVKLNEETYRLSKEVKSSLKKLIDWLLDVVELEEHKDRMQYMYKARDDVKTLGNQQKRLEDKTAELDQKRAWSYEERHREVLNLYADIQELSVVLIAADHGLYALVKKFVHNNGKRFVAERDWRSERRQSLWDGIERFRHQVKQLPKPPRGRSTTTTTVYKVRYVKV